MARKQPHRNRALCMGFFEIAGNDRLPELDKLDLRERQGSSEYETMYITRGLSICNQLYKA